MADPLTLSVLGGAALTEGIRFLYNQADELIKAARERRRGAPEGDRQPGRVEVAAVQNQVLDGPLPSTVNGRVLDQEHRTLDQLAAPLAPYARGDADVNSGNVELLAAAHRLRVLLEAVYGQRLTLSGEQREPTGTRVDIRQLLGEVEGEASALQVGIIEDGAHVKVEQSATRVKQGGSIVGAEIDRIGGGAR